LSGGVDGVGKMVKRRHIWVTIGPTNGHRGIISVHLQRESCDQIRCKLLFKWMNSAFLP